MSYAYYAPPIARASDEVRARALRKVAGLTLTGLLTATASGFASVLALTVMPFLWSPIAQFAVMFGSYAVAQFAMRSVVYRSTSTTTKLAGFYGGAVFEGISFGYLLTVAMLFSAQRFGNPFVFLGEALALVSLTGVGMFAYLMTGPKQLSLVRAGLSMLFLPMVALMVLTFVFPVGGVFGIALSALFVVISAAGLLVQLNDVVHKMPPTMVVEGSFNVMMGLLILFWNVLSLLMRLQRR